MKASSLAVPPFEITPDAPSRLTEVTEFGSNPGNLRMLAYVPENLAPSPALVVVLHGCTQTAAGYDHGAGWSALADRYGFVLVLPEQVEANNQKRCFNWFRLGDIRRGRGEALSIRQMVERAIRDHGIDRSRIFATGLSAGGAMTATMLATYPDIFAGGAIVAGLPYQCATSVSEAFECMFQGRTRPAGEWGDLVRNASPHRGPWPKVSVWHGSADATVRHMNAGEIIKQWTNVHGLDPQPDRSETVDGYPRNVWTDAAGEEVIEEYVITGMAHGTPLATGDGENSYGAAGPFLLEAGISSSYHIAKFWGLTETAPDTAHVKRTVRPPPPDADLESPSGRVTVIRRSDGTRKPASAADIQSTITQALRAAGLMK
ncbi:extracellular catalytic domain type 1 short-chain-length polyhydroxyalkanoate depolymerase [Microvirga roseola]|uniref:extracellular catalytic domain type 1 short-chain-length polyhydroxyalkanoate depolymerase n=1 Tax=Microvirga roseola TaxID=2883126 RepID=UPI001E4CAB94|nr:PHB depolymerase family esterase [Microvirga roseola]